MIFHSAAGHALHLCSFVGVYLVCCYPLVIESVDVGVQISLCGPDLSSSHCIPRYEIVSYGKPNLIFFCGIIELFHRGCTTYIPTCCLLHCFSSADIVCSAQNFAALVLAGCSSFGWLCFWHLS